MSLQESLNKFKQQQENCQTTLSTFETRAAPAARPSHKHKPTATPNQSPPKPPAPQVKFSNDTQRLQHINQIKNSPVGAQIKLVIDLLYQEESMFVKLNVRCTVKVDIFIECIDMDDKLVHEELMFRVMFNTAFVQSNTLVLGREEIDVVWNVKDQFPKDFKIEFLQSMPVLVNRKENMTADVGVRLLGGSLSGITAASVTYPLDLVRTRLMWACGDPDTYVLVQIFP